MEESTTEGSKSKLIIVSVIVIILVIASIGIYLIGGGASGITAMEGREIAEQLALNWSDNATLVYVTGDPHQAIAYRYWNLTNNTINCLEVTVYTNKVTETRYTRCLHDEYPICNWTIDSDEAYEIAMDNENINSFMAHYPTLDSFSLATPRLDNNSVWYIYWCYNAGFDDPKWAQIQIDATTGEVLYVEADN